MALTIKKLMADALKTATTNGFRPADRNAPTRDFAVDIALIHSEVSEALEEQRAPHSMMTETYYMPDKPTKPEGVPSELADIMIRVAESAEWYGIDLEAAILEKMAYNKTRPYKHGKKF